MGEEAKAQRVLWYVQDCQGSLEQTQNQNSGSSHLTDQILKHCIISKAQRTHGFHVPTWLYFYFKKRGVKGQYCFLVGDKVHLKFITREMVENCDVVQPGFSSSVTIS